MSFAEPYTAVDVEDAVREWGRQLPYPVFFGVNNQSTFPQITLQRIGGTDDDCLVQFDVWGGTKKEAAAAAADLASALTELATFDHAGIRLHDASWLGTQWIPDPESDRPRYVLEATFFATAL